MIKLSLKDKDEQIWAEGKIFTGAQALELKLIDKIGSRLTAVEEIKKRGIIDGEVRFVKPPKINPIAKLLGQESDDDESPFIKSIVYSICSSICSFFTKEKITAL